MSRSALPGSARQVVTGQPQRPVKDTPGRRAWRFITGQPLDGYRRSDATFRRAGTRPLVDGDHVSRWHMMPGYKRVMWRFSPLWVGLVGLFYFLAPITTSLGIVTTAFVVAPKRLSRASHWWRHRHFRRIYLQPLAEVLATELGVSPAVALDQWLTVTPDLPGLAPDLVEPMSQAEKWIREQWGTYVEQMVRWAPDRVMRGLWWMRERARPATSKLDVFRTPTENKPHIRIKLAGQFLTPDQKIYVRAALAAKLGLPDLVESWNEVGRACVGTYTVKVRPPDKCGLADIIDAIDRCAEHEFVLGLRPGGSPKIVSVDDDAAHVCASAGSGAGKSVLAMLFAIQVLRRGGRVLILDRKGSHRWARGLNGVTYCTKPADMHAALIGAASLADARNSQAMEEDDDWNPGERVWIIFEEMNATMAQLVNYWETVRGKGDPKTSPAVTAFRELMYMGRSAKVNLFAVAQMLTARTTGGPEARENFGIRCLARYTANAWKMLVPECAMPRKSKTRGRWQVCIAGEAEEVQVAFLTTAEAREIAVPRVPCPRVAGDLAFGAETARAETAEEHRAEGATPPRVGLREAVSAGAIPATLPAARKHSQRFAATFPRGIEDGGELKYDRAELVAWYESRSIAPKVDA